MKCCCYGSVLVCVHERSKTELIVTLVLFQLSRDGYIGSPS